MEYVYAALMLHATSKEVTEDGVTKVLTAAGAKPNKARVKALIAALEGINIEDAISKATFAPLAAPVAPPAAAPAAEAKKEETEKKEEEEVSKEEEEETGMEGLGALFG